MKLLTQSISFIVLAIALLSSTSVKTQNTRLEETQISLSGRVNCVNPINDILSSVIVYNLSKEYGTVTDEDGNYLIKMGKNDTILFSTAEHKEYLYFIDRDDKFEDSTLNVKMITDAIWLNTVTIMGFNNLEQFKQEILDLDIPQGDIDLALPVVNKYAKIQPLMVREYDLIGPLTYLQNKFKRHYKIKNKIR